jgi:5-methyltetrahydrofolate--homocysteine methyltransferase
MMTMSNIKNISDYLQMGKANLVEKEVKEALEKGVSAADILNDGLLDGMGKLGVKFKNNEVYVPEVLIAARALNKGIEIIKPRLIDAGVKPIGKVILATVKGDLHDIGKNLVRMMLVGAGFEVIDLGIDVPDAKIVEAVREHKPNIVALSALLTTTMGAQGDVIKALKDAGLRESVKVMVGGAPVTQSFCDSIGADAYTSDAASCAEVAKSFI